MTVLISALILALTGWIPVEETTLFNKIEIDGTGWNLKESPLRDLDEKDFGSLGLVFPEDYYVYWKITDGRLYLTCIRKAESGREPQYRMWPGEYVPAENIEKATRMKFTGNGIPAYWFSDTLYAYKGKPLGTSRKSRLSRIYEMENELVFKDGMLVSARSFENKPANDGIEFSELLDIARNKVHAKISEGELGTFIRKERFRITLMLNSLKCQADEEGNLLDCDIRVLRTQLTDDRTDAIVSAFKDELKRAGRLKMYRIHDKYSIGDNLTWTIPIVNPVPDPEEKKPRL